MTISVINRKETGIFSQQQIGMCYNQAVFSDFITAPFSIEAFEQQIQQKKVSFSSDSRKTLVEALKNQYRNLEINPKVSDYIESLLDENTFTVVTGHQLVAMTGPLYFIYKIAHVIRSTEELKQKYPASKFVPIFWMATEDHDYEEIKSFHLFNRTISWETEQTGPVGRFEMKDWQPVIDELLDLFKNHPESEIVHLLNNFSGENYTAAFRKLVNQLIGEFGVVIIDGDDTLLKRSFLPYMQKEIRENYSFKAINDTTEKLVAAGGKQQIISREINLFYIGNGVRERLIETDGKIEIAGKGNYSKEEILSWMEQHPEDFSPNVSLRPLYQEVILPNLCYVGGAGEINYWLQLKGVFDAAHVVFPLIQVRNSVLWIDRNSKEKMDKLELTALDFFRELHILQKEYLAKNAGDEVDFSDLDRQMEVLKNQIIATTQVVDTSLEAYATAESVRIEKQLSQIKDRLYKTVKGKHDKNLKSIQQVKERLFPDNGLQERYTNFFQLNPSGNYSETLKSIVENMQPFSGDIIVMEE